MDMVKKLICGGKRGGRGEGSGEGEERGRGRDRDSKLTIYSAGAILYVLLCGCPPFDDGKPISIFDQIRQGLVEFPDPAWTNVSPSGTIKGGREGEEGIERGRERKSYCFYFLFVNF
jgi:hypothetical protein